MRYVFLQEDAHTEDGGAMVPGPGAPSSSQATDNAKKRPEEADEHLQALEKAVKRLRL